MPRSTFYMINTKSRLRALYELTAMLQNVSVSNTSFIYQGASSISGHQLRHEPIWNSVHGKWLLFLLTSENLSEPFPIPYLGHISKAIRWKAFKNVGNIKTKLATLKSFLTVDQIFEFLLIIMICHIESLACSLISMHRWLPGNCMVKWQTAKDVSWHKLL